VVVSNSALAVAALAAALNVQALEQGALELVSKVLGPDAAAAAQEALEAILHFSA